MPTLIYRRINPAIHGEICLAHHREACLLSYGCEHRRPTADAYLAWLKSRVQEYPDGHALVYLEGGKLAGQLEMGIPYRLKRGYIDLYFVTQKLRGLGFGTAMHAYVERYFRAWDAEEIELHVARTNESAL